MRIRVQTWGRPKAGNSPDEYEDAFWPSGADRQTSVLRVAVADGATEASFSGLWAQLLVRAYGAGRLTSRLKEEALLQLQAEWRRQVGTKPLPWYAEEKLRDGAFSSLLGLTLSERSDRPRHWHALAIGDSCLFQIRDGALLVAFPLDSAAAFNSRPHLLSSNPTHNSGLRSNLCRSAGDLRSGDSFFLLTDAIAAWFLYAAETGASPWDILRSEIAEGTLPTLCDELRLAGNMRNDDFTVMLVDVE